MKQRIEVHELAYGQPKAYADHQYVYLVKFFEERLDRVDGEWVTEMVPNDCRVDKFWDPVKHEERLIKKALAILGYENVQSKAERSASNEDSWFSSYIDYAKYLGSGEVEVRYVSPYID